MKTLADKISVKIAYTRSIHLERDAPTLIDEYLPGEVASRILKDIAFRIKNPGLPRAFSLIGPYGAGKSAFALFISRLLGDPKDPGTRRATTICRKYIPAVANSYRNLKSNRRGFCSLLITGSPQSLTSKFLERLSDSLKGFLGGRESKLVMEIRQAAKSVRTKPSDAIALLVRAEKSVRRAGGGGILIVFDELGKFLEYEARTTASDGVFLLQEIAEYARSQSEANIIILALLHHAFGQYAKGLNREAKNEWSKAQGRFEEIAFIESAEQSLRLVARALTNKFTIAEKAKIHKAVSPIARTLLDTGILAGGDKKEAEKLLADCYPLHPVVAVMLPLLCQKVAQNERTLFSYLSGRETHGFLESVQHLSKIGEFIEADKVYDYFIVASPSTDSITARRWAEAESVVDRLGNGCLSSINMLKIIALFNLIGARGKFAASPALLKLSLREKAETAIDELQKKSFIVYRRFADEYRIWQGSDFNLDEALETAVGEVGVFNVAERLNLSNNMPPLTAHKHAVETGNLRPLKPYFVDRELITRSIPNEDGTPRLILFIPSAPSEKRHFRREMPKFGESDILIYCENGSHLREIIIERNALEGILSRCPELKGDAAALRETRKRLSDVVHIERRLLHELLLPGGGEWYWNGKAESIKNRRDIQTLISRVMGAIYQKAPSIHNELINRDKPSGQAAAARRKLLLALAAHENEENLGIEKFPPEKAVYLSLFKSSGMHRKKGGSWQLCPPTSANDKHNFLPVWDEISRFIEGTKDKPRSFAELDLTLRAAPYGIKEGVLPILYIAVCLYGKDDIAIFENGDFVPFFTEPHIERFLANPDTFKVQKFEVVGFRAAVMEQYVRLLSGDKNNTTSKTTLAVARPFAQFSSRLPEFTRQTATISKPAQALRAALEYSKSPHQMLFEKIPKALGFSGNEVDIFERKDFFTTLKDILTELNQAYPRLRNRFQELLAIKFGMSENAELGEVREICQNSVAGLLLHAPHSNKLRPFLSCLGDTRDDDERWLTGTLMTLIQKPAEKWSDIDCAKAEINLDHWVQQIYDLRRIKSYDLENRTGRRGNFVLLRALRDNSLERRAFAFIDDDKKVSIHAIARKIQNELEQHDLDLRRAILAELVYNQLPSEIEGDAAEFHESKKEAKSDG